MEMGSDAYDSSVSDTMVEWGEERGHFLRCLPSRRAWITPETTREIEQLARGEATRCALCNNTYTSNYRLICHLRSHFIRHICACNRINFSTDSCSRHQRKNTDDVSPICRMRFSYQVDRESFPAFVAAMKLALPSRFTDLQFPTFYPTPVRERPDNNSSSSSGDFTKQLRVCLNDAVRSVSLPEPPVPSTSTGVRPKLKFKKGKTKSSTTTRSSPYPASTSSTSVPSLRPLSRRDRNQHESLADLSIRLYSISTWARERPRSGDEVADQLNHLRALIERLMSDMYIPEDKTS